MNDFDSETENLEDIIENNLSKINTVRNARFRLDKNSQAYRAASQAYDLEEGQNIYKQLVVFKLEDERYINLERLMDVQIEDGVIQIDNIYESSLEETEQRYSVDIP